jgi:LDH2 family malate/lactate/ureidoglycolate dehydrogenase
LIREFAPALAAMIPILTGHLTDSLTSPDRELADVVEDTEHATWWGDGVAALKTERYYRGKCEETEQNWRKPIWFSTRTMRREGAYRSGWC